MKVFALTCLSAFILTLLSQFQNVSSTLSDVNRRQNVTVQNSLSTFIDRLGFGSHNSTADGSSKRSLNSEVNEEEDEDDLDLDEDDLDDDDTALATTKSRELSKSDSNDRYISMSGQKIKLEKDQTVLIIPTKARGLGLLTLKALILGPIIGLTIKAALMRGLIWAVGAYLIHLFFPSVLSALGLGSGLVGFARQLQQPSLASLIIQNLAANYPVTASNTQPIQTNLKNN